MRDVGAPPVSETRLTAAARALGPVAATEALPALPARRFKGPLELDLNRIVLPHRVENVPPPPDFVFEPFVSSRLAEPASPSASTAGTPLAPIEPAACRIVDARDAGRRVDRGWRVDIAPCLAIGASAASSERAVSPPAARTVAPTPVTTISQEPSRRLARRRGRVAARALSPLPDSEEVSRAIHELEAAFGQAALHSALDESAGVAGCRANGA